MFNLVCFTIILGYSLPHRQLVHGGCFFGHPRTIVRTTQTFSVTYWLNLTAYLFILLYCHALVFGSVCRVSVTSRLGLCCLSLAFSMVYIGWYSSQLGLSHCVSLGNAHSAHLFHTGLFSLANLWLLLHLFSVDMFSLVCIFFWPNGRIFHMHHIILANFLASHLIHTGLFSLVTLTLLPLFSVEMFSLAFW